LHLAIDAAENVSWRYAALLTAGVVEPRLKYANFALTA
jgi:hypothetical protein